MKFQKKSKVSTNIPTASMPDIVFMLLLFFMVTTVFRQFSGLPVDLPSARKIAKLDAKKNVANIWASLDGEISVDDKIIDKMSNLKQFFKGFTKGFRDFSNIITNIVNFFLLTIVYIFGVGITSILSKTFKKHFLELKKTKSKTYWKKTKLTKEPIEKYFRQF